MLLVGVNVLTHPRIFRRRVRWIMPPLLRSPDVSEASARRGQAPFTSLGGHHTMCEDGRTLSQEPNSANYDPTAKEYP